MTYAETRDEETLRLLEPAIKAFITQCQQPANPSSPCARQTMFFFPGGMASRLVRANEPFDDTDPSPQTFTYDPVWIELGTLFGGAMDLAMYWHISSGTFRDKGDRIIIADEALGLDLTLTPCTPHTGLINWCHNNNVDLFVFPWDWRRRLDETVTFFVSKFLPCFQARVVDAGCPDPLLRFALVGHSFGGMIVNLILRNGAPILANMTSAITVATPFYGYPGQVHRWFEGEDLLNLFGYLEQAMMEMIATLPGLYTLHFLDTQTWDANEAALTSGEFPIAKYPSVDATDTTLRADPYNPNTYGSLVRYPGMTGFNRTELDFAEGQSRMLVSSMDPGQLQKFYNIRGVQTGLDGKTPINSTPASVTWDWIPPNFDAKDGPPITDVKSLPGDGTQPAWTTCLVTNAPERRITVKAFGIDHMFMMSHPSVLQAIATILCPSGGAVAPPETALPEEAGDEEMVEFLKWLSEHLLVIRRFNGFNDPEFRDMLSNTRFRNRLPNLARRFISDVMKRPGPKGLRPPDGDAGRRRPRAPDSRQGGPKKS